MIMLKKKHQYWFLYGALSFFAAYIALVVYVCFATSSVIGGMELVFHCCGVLISAIVGGVVGFAIQICFLGYRHWIRRRFNNNHHESLLANGEEKQIDKLTQEYVMALHILKKQKQATTDEVGRSVIDKRIKELKRNYYKSILVSKKSLW
jgi:hypothetical protein